MRIMLADERRARFAQLAAEQQASYVTLSRVLRRSEGYFSAYLRDRVPYDLAPADRGRLARFFGVDEATLRPLPPRRPKLWRR